MSIPNKKNYYPIWLLWSCLGWLLLTSTGCVKHRDLISFSRPALGTNTPEAIINATNLEIQPEDLLRITVHSIDPLAAAPFNIDGGDGNRQQMGGNQGTQQLELFMGYFVDAEGYIDFPVLGRLAVKGKTLEQVRNDLVERLKRYLTDPVVNIRYLNFKVTVLGEVNAPGTLRLTNKRVTVLDALGMVGDVTQYGNRREILVIREEEGLRSTARLNLQSPTLFESPYFYLQQNDVIYVEPLPVRVATVADPAQRIISYSTGALSLVSIIIALTSRN